MAGKIALTEEQIAEYKEAFAVFDQDGNGTITVNELMQVMSNLGQKCSLEDAKKMIAEADSNKNESIEFGEFVEMMQKSSTSQKDELERAFKIFDKDGNGWITHSELKQAMQEMGQELSDKEITEMIKSADLDNDEQINFEEFKKMMS